MAKKMIDYAVGAGNDLLISGGDFVRRESTAKHQQELIVSGKNDFKQNPTIGVDAVSYLDGEGFNALINEISSEFQRDGMDVVKVELQPDGTLEADAYYK